MTYLSLLDYNSTMEKLNKEELEFTKLQVRIEKEALKKVQEKAKKSRLTVSQIVRKMLDDYVSDPQGKLIF